MSERPLDDIIQSAIAEGILPEGAAPPQSAHRPWPVMLLTALGGWLAAVPLILIVFISLGGVLAKGPWPYIIGLLLLAACVAMLRRKDLPLFLEQLTVPGLLAAGGVLGIGLFRDFSDNLAAALLALLACAVAFVVPRNWLRILLGAAACALTAIALLPGKDLGEDFRSWLAVHAVVVLWLAARWERPGITPEFLERLSLGWIAMAIAGLAIWSGMTFLAGASLDAWPTRNVALPWIGPAVSVLLSGAAALWIALRWPSLKQPWSAFAALILLGIAWLMPSLGAVLLILAICAAERRWPLAIAAGGAAAWIVGAFYYQVSYPLATKALILAGVGALLGAIAWIALRGTRTTAAPHTKAAVSRSAGFGVAMCALAVLAVANIGIWQKETLIAQGRPVFVELAPVDPRSLMQGDYMRLAFRLPQEARLAGLEMPGARRIHAVGTIDARGVATLERISKDGAHAASEISIELTPHEGGWMLVTDAWYFKEGEAQRWARAKYGEFRVAPDGRALLVGLRGPALEAL